MQHRLPLIAGTVQYNKIQYVHLPPPNIQGKEIDINYHQDLVQYNVKHLSPTSIFHQ